MGRLVEARRRTRPPVSRVRRPSPPAAAGGPAFLTVPRARASRDDLQAEGWTGQRVAPGGRTGSGTADRGDPAERRVGGHGPDCGGSP